MSKKMRSISAILATLLILCFATTALAAVPENTIVIGDKAWDANLLFDPEFSQTILDAFMENGGNLNYVDFDNKIQDFLGEEVDASEWPEVTYTDVEGNQVRYEEGNGDPIVQDGELEVVEVSAINANYVVVKITAPEEDLLAQEVEVKNGAGVVVPVKPLDIAAGDETAEFEFVTAVKADDLVGVWTINGQPYDLDLFNKIVDFLEASTQIELNEALVALNLDNYDVANIKEYFAAQQKLVGTVEATELKLADIQKLVDDANAKVAEGKDEAALIKAIKDAHTANNQVAFLEALNNAGLTQVNPDWVAVENDGYFATIDGTEADLDAIQAKVNTANETIISTKVTDAGIDKAKLTASKELIEKYAPLTDKGVINDSGIKTSLEKIEKQLAVVAVLEATTPTALKARIAELAEIANPEKGDKVVDMKNYRDANGKAYLAYIADENNVVNTPETVNAALTAVNGQIDGRLAITKFEVKNEENYDSKAKGEVRLLGYWVEVTLNDEFKIKDTDSIVIELLDEKDNVLGKQSLNAYGYKNHGDTNKIGGTIDAYGEYVATSWDHEWYGELTDIPDKAVAKVKYKVDGAIAEAEETNLDGNTTLFEKAIVDDLVEDINEAETVADVKAALDALADINKVADYLTIRSADRDFVAAYVLQERPEDDDGYNELSGVEAQVTESVTAHGAALDAINGLKYTSTPDEVVEALDKILDEDFDKLSNTGKINAAEAFHDKLVFDEEGALKTPFRTLADVKALLK